MRSIDAEHWTADFQLARALWEAYQEEVREGVHVVCLGDPREPFDRTVLEIGDELSRYHPHVYGVPEEPVTRETLRQVTEAHLDAWSKGFLIAIAGTVGSETGARVRVLTGDGVRDGIGVPVWSGRNGDPGDSGDPEAGASGDPEGWVLYPDAAVLAVVARPASDGGGLEPVPERHRRKCRDAIIDGILRLYFRLGHDHTRHMGRRRR